MGLKRYEPVAIPPALLKAHQRYTPSVSHLLNGVSHHFSVSGTITVGNTTVRQIYALVDLCRIKYLFGQAGGMRGGKTFSGVLCRRDFAANLCFYPTTCLAKARRQTLPEFFRRADPLPVRLIKYLGIHRIMQGKGS
jgi:hypothetical protein